MCKLLKIEIKILKLTINIFFPFFGLIYVNTYIIMKTHKLFSNMRGVCPPYRVLTADSGDQGKRPWKETWQLGLAHAHY